MSELIRRENCHEQINRMRAAITTLATHFHMLPSQAQMLTEEVLRKLNLSIDEIPTITTDDVLAYKCPECREISILYDPENEEFCPNCGIRRNL